MPRVKAYRRKDGTLVRAHSRGTVSVGSFRRRTGSLGHLKRTGGSRTPSFLSTALRDWNSRNTYMDRMGNLRYYGHAAPRGMRKGSITKYSKRVKHVYGLGKPPYEGSMRFHGRAKRMSGS